MNIASCTWMRGLAGGLIAAAMAAGAAAPEVAPGIFQVGRIEHPALRECSGVVPVRGQTNAFWMHSDGRRPILYAVSRGGQSLQDYLLDTPRLLDWEDLATDRQGHLYVADTGNNDARRERLAVYQVPEPDLAKANLVVKVQQAWILEFPGKPFDCESLFVWKKYGYVVSKVFDDAPAEVYRFPLTATNETLKLEWVARTSITSPVTGADISPDGKNVAMVAHNGIYLMEIDGHPTRIGQAKARQAKFKDQRIEGICFVPEGLLATAETREIYLLTSAAFGKAKGKGKN